MTHTDVLNYVNQIDFQMIFVQKEVISTNIKFVGRHLIILARQLLVKIRDKTRLKCSIYGADPG